MEVDDSGKEVKSPETEEIPKETKDVPVPPKVIVKVIFSKNTDF
jgi:hypothetical protein